MSLLRQRRPCSEFHQAARSALPEVFRQTVRFNGADQGSQDQEVAPTARPRDRARRGLGPFFSSTSQTHGRFRSTKSRLRVRIDCAPPRSPRFQRSLRKIRESGARSRTFSDRRAPEKIRFGRRQPIYARFSLSRIKPVPLWKGENLHARWPRAPPRP